MKLVLVRHAKSDWDDPTLSDHDRPLNARGRHDAPRLGAWLRAQGHIPTRAVVSTATRAVETWAGLAEGLGTNLAPDYVKALYHAPPETLMSHIRCGDTDTLLIVAHNPGIAACAVNLLATAPQHPRFDDYPTCATLIAETTTPDWGTATALDFVTPHDLP